MKRPENGGGLMKGIVGCGQYTILPVGRDDSVKTNIGNTLSKDMGNTSPNF